VSWLAPRSTVDRSGFDGPWTFSPTTFTNDYFKLLFDEKWSWRKWGGPAQFTDSKTKSLMMLPSDMSLTKDKEFKKHAKAYAEDQDLFFKEWVQVMLIAVPAYALERNGIDDCNLIVSLVL
jgi:cytochrome c peroxidase